MYSSYFVLFARLKTFLKRIYLQNQWSLPLHFRFFYKAYFCKSERKSPEKGLTGETQLNGSPVNFGNVLQAGGKCSKDNNPPGKKSIEEEITTNSKVLTKEIEAVTCEDLAEEKPQSAFTDCETAAQDRENFKSPQIPEEVTSPEESKTKTEKQEAGGFDQYSTGGGGAISDTESKKDK